MNNKVFSVSILLMLLFFSCSKKIDSKVEVVEDTSACEPQEVKNLFEPEKSYNMDLTEYKIYGQLRPGYELGYDDNYHAYLTDKRSGKQIVFLCSSWEPSYVKEDFLKHYDDAIAEDRDLKDVLANVIEWCKERAVKQEIIFDEHFNRDIERYYVMYTVGYACFHI